MEHTVIRDVRGRKIFDSRGNPTIEVEVFTEIGYGRAAAPSGASRGKNEAVAFPDGDVDKALERLEKLVVPQIVGMNAVEQEEIDETLKDIDGTGNFSNIGGNTAIALSIAVAKAAADSLGLPLFRYLGGFMVRYLPYPLGNVLGGGAHAGEGAPDIQEFLVLPVGAESVEEALMLNSRVHKEVKAEIQRRYPDFAGGKGDEGAWVHKLTNEEAIEIVRKSVEKVSDEYGIEIELGMDMAASQLWDGEKYVYKRAGKSLTRDEQIDFVCKLVEDYDLFYVEDPLHEEDFEGFARLTDLIGEKCYVVGDDLFVTNPERIFRGAEMGAANGCIIKPNQIGTLTDTLEAIEVAFENGMLPVLSHRSGETEDPAIAHIAVGFGIPVIKAGVVGGERTAKLNELIRIEEALGISARMPMI